jgi:hypothetical protein
MLWHIARQPGHRRIVIELTPLRNSAKQPVAHGIKAREWNPLPCVDNGMAGSLGCTLH